jgi:hypothetical protein
VCTIWYCLNNVYILCVSVTSCVSLITVLLNLDFLVNYPEYVIIALGECVVIGSVWHCGE